MTYGYFKDLTRRTTSDNILCDTALNIAKNPKYDGYQRRLASVIYSFLIKKILVVVLKMWTLQTKDEPEHYTKQLLENLIKETYTHLLWIILGMLILLIYN